jgi:predicted SnoaL-like aldol condensation-catalyzing enzyme
MKKILSLFAFAIIFICVSCGDNKTEKTAADTMTTDKKDNSMAEKNIAASHIVNKAFETGDASAIDNAVANDFVDHTDQGDKNRDSLKTMIAVMHKEFPDMKMEMIKEMADDDYVFSLMRWTGTSNGQMGMPKGPYDMKAIEVVRFKDGLAVEHWSYMQPADVIKMMPPMPAAKMDDKVKGK